MVGTLMAGKLLDILGGLPEYVCIAFTQEGAEHLGQARCELACSLSFAAL